MNDDIKVMLQIYGDNGIDWLGYSYNDASELTRHHIVKKQYNGQDDISNYALLTHASHMFLHYMEEKYNKEYTYLNSRFLELNRSQKPPTIEYYEDVKKIMKRIRKLEKNKDRIRRR